MSRQKEGVIESYLCRRVKLLGGVAEKLVFYSKAGSPDRWCILPGGRVYPVECKAADGKLSAIQKITIEGLRSLGLMCFVVSSKEEVDAAIAQMEADGLR